MTDPDRDPAGDYGYDMAHEDMARARTARDPRDAGQEPRPAAGAGRTSDAGEDLGYDEAHGF